MNFPWFIHFTIFFNFFFGGGRGDGAKSNSLQGRSKTKSFGGGPAQLLNKGIYIYRMLSSLVSSGAWGYAPPENFENWSSLRRCLHGRRVTLLGGAPS